MQQNCEIFIWTQKFGAHKNHCNSALRRLLLHKKTTVNETNLWCSSGPLLVQLPYLHRITDAVFSGQTLLWSDSYNFCDDLKQLPAFWPCLLDKPKDSSWVAILNRNSIYFSKVLLPSKTICMRLFFQDHGLFVVHLVIRLLLWSSGYALGNLRATFLSSVPFHRSHSSVG